MKKCARWRELRPRAGSTTPNAPPRGVNRDAREAYRRARVAWRRAWIASRSKRTRDRRLEREIPLGEAMCPADGMPLASCGVTDADDAGARESIWVGVRVRPQNSREMAARGTHLTMRSHERATVHGLREPPLGSWPARPPPRASVANASRISRRTQSCYPGAELTPATVPAPHPPQTRARGK